MFPTKPCSEGQFASVLRCLQEVSYIMGDVVWRPTTDDLTNSRIQEFITFVNRSHNKSISSYEELHNFSVTDYQFWRDLAVFLRVKFSVPPSIVLLDKNPAMYPPPRFFPNSMLNYAQNCLQGHNDNHTAIISITEGAHLVTRYSYADLKSRVHKISDA